MFSERIDILVATARQTENDYRVFFGFGHDTVQGGDGVGALEGGNDPFGPAEELRGLKRRGVRHGAIMGASRVGEKAMFGADSGVVEPGRDRMRFLNLTVVVLEHVLFAAVENPYLAHRNCGGVACRIDPFARGFDAMELDRVIVIERREKPDTVRAASNAGD